MSYSHIWDAFCDFHHNGIYESQDLVMIRPHLSQSPSRLEVVSEFVALYRLLIDAIGWRAIGEYQVIEDGTFKSTLDQDKPVWTIRSIGGIPRMHLSLRFFSDIVQAALRRAVEADNTDSFGRYWLFHEQVEFHRSKKVEGYSVYLFPQLPDRIFILPWGPGTAFPRGMRDFCSHALRLTSEPYLKACVPHSEYTLEETVERETANILMTDNERANRERRAHQAKKQAISDAVKNNFEKYQQDGQ